MTVFQQLQNEYRHDSCGSIEIDRLEQLRDNLKQVDPTDITSAKDGKNYIDLLKKFREAVARVDKLHGDNYPQLLNSLLSVGEDGLYSNSLRFIFELIQNVDDCDYKDSTDCKLDMRFDFEKDEIILTYNEVGFTPFNVFAITGIAEAAKNVSSEKNQIGEKGIGFKSVFGVSDMVQIRSGWFSFELRKNNFTIPIPAYNNFRFCNGTEMTLFVPGKARQIYKEIKEQYCKKDALFSRNPLLFLNKLTSLHFYYDNAFRYMKFYVSRSENKYSDTFRIEKDIHISMDLRDNENGSEIQEKHDIQCTRYTYYVTFSKEACRARYGEKTHVGQENGKSMLLSVVIPHKEYVAEVGNGALYSFLPTQLKLNVPIVCHVPFKLDASREFVDSQDNNLWFIEASNYLAEFMDRVYLNHCRIVKEDIIHYLPKNIENMFMVQNDKEKCLTRQCSFWGGHYASLEIFHSIDGNYYKAEKVFSFNNKENISDPKKVYQLMECKDHLFLSPVLDVKEYGIRVESNVLNKLFKTAFYHPDSTEGIINYLTNCSYEYSSKQIPQEKNLYLSYKQIELFFGDTKLAEVLMNAATKNVKMNMRLMVNVDPEHTCRLIDALGSDFELNETPKKVEKYLKDCGEMCILANIDENYYFPCSNAIVLSNKNAMSSFASFCYAIDEGDTFALRMKMKQASKQLDLYVNAEYSDEEFLRQLCNIRKLVKESLGKEGYRNFLDLILKSGTNRGRFIQELLQNADDCIYAQNVTPTFSLYQKGSKIITEYNETGFTRANIRSITAIAESTKKKLLSPDSTSIGEKGVGFKTIFAIASKVTIHSGNYHFSLSDKEPTIPKIINRASIEPVSGTRMEIELNGDEAFPTYKENDILELCLCLRNLKKLTIGKHTVIISDADDKRTISIGNRDFIFKRFHHDFTITDEKALEERKNGSREISADQQIVCYVPLNPINKDYHFPLYCGLPTKHKLNIPMAIDAPFSLTTSREEIETEGSKWNALVRSEIYSAIFEVIDSLKTEERSRVLRFIRARQIPQNGRSVYYNDTFDLSYLNKDDFISILAFLRIIPTFDQEEFAVPSEKTAYRYPFIVSYILKNISSDDFGKINTKRIIDIDYNYNDFKVLITALNALKCEEASFSDVYPFIYQYAERFIQEDVFRNALYEYLLNPPSEYLDGIKSLKIIPVYSSDNDSTIYISWEKDSIFVKPNSLRSGDNYYVLNETILSEDMYNNIYDTHLNEINIELEHSRYNAKLKEMITSANDITSIYKYIITEYKAGRLAENDSFDLLRLYRIPLKNALGQITKEQLFICEDEKQGYFTTELLMGITVHDECRGLAKDIEIKSLSGIHYDDFYYDEELTQDEVEELLDDPDHFFVNYEELLRGFYNDDLLSDALLQEYNLGYLSIGRSNDNGNDNNYEFPKESVGDRYLLASHIRKLWTDPIKVVSVIVEQSVRMGQNKDGSTFKLDIKDAREGALTKYTPEGGRDLCFCQMCQRVKSKRLIKVNNVELLPEYFFPQLRIALCMECSKRFEILRETDYIRETFIEKIKQYEISDDSPNEIPIGDSETIKFTAKHLAEIQEILKQKPKNNK